MYCNFHTLHVYLLLLLAELIELIINKVIDKSNVNHKRII